MSESEERRGESSRTWRRRRNANGATRSTVDELTDDAEGSGRRRVVDKQAAFKRLAVERTFANWHFRKSATGA